MTTNTFILPEYCAPQSKCSRVVINQYESFISGTSCLLHYQDDYVSELHFFCRDIAEFEYNILSGVRRDDVFSVITRAIKVKCHRYSASVHRFRILDLTNYYVYALQHIQFDDLTKLLQDITTQSIIMIPIGLNSSDNALIN